MVEAFVLRGGLSRFPALEATIEYAPLENNRSRFRIGTQYVDLQIWRKNLAVVNPIDKEICLLKDWILKNGPIETRKVMSRRSFANLQRTNY